MARSAKRTASRTTEHRVTIHAEMHDDLTWTVRLTGGENNEIRQQMADLYREVFEFDAEEIQAEGVGPWGGNPTSHIFAEVCDRNDLEIQEQPGPTGSEEPANRDVF